MDRRRVDRICVRVKMHGRQPEEAGGRAGGLFTWGRPAGDLPIGRKRALAEVTCGWAGVVV